VLTGENGAGKTNVLEALSLLAPGRGLRRASLSEMVRQGGSGGFGVGGALDDVEIGTGTQPDAPERRLVRINGAPAAAAALAEWVTVLWLTPAMDRLFVEGPGRAPPFPRPADSRLAPGHAHQSTRYEAAMRQRNRLLADEAPADPEWLTRWKRGWPSMAPRSTPPGASRHALAERLAAQPEGVFARAGLAIEGWQGDAETLARELRDGRRRDAAAGRTLAGTAPRRSAGHPSRQDAARASLLDRRAEGAAARAGAGPCRTGRRPHRPRADPAARRSRRAPGSGPPRGFVRSACRPKGQVWMTGTEPGLFETDTRGRDALCRGPRNDRSQLAAMALEPVWRK
jgi:DNA replication and repair protein RecF